MTAPLISPHPAGAKQIIKFGLTGDTTNFSASAAAGNAAVVSATGDTNNRPIIVDGIFWSYSADPTTGKISLGDSDGNLYAEFDIPKGGPDSFVPPTPILIPGGKTMNVTLAGVAAITGKLYVSCYRLK